MLDTDRMTDGKALATELRQGKGGGIPWMVILDGGKALATSDGPKGNCGCPATPDEIAHFLNMLDTTRQHMTDEDRAVIERELRLYGAELTADRRKMPGYAEWTAAAGHVRFGHFAEAVGRLGKAVAAGYPVEAITVDPALRPLREDPDRRQELFELARKNVSTGTVTMVGRDEPGRRIRLRGRVVDMATGSPLSGALMQVFHTDAGGEYRPGMDAGGGAGNPRLWAFLRTDAEGRFTVDTIMPERYTNSSVPRHVHYRVWAEGYPQLNSECFFDSDPLLSEKTRSSAPSRNFPIVTLRADAEHRMVGELVVKVPKK